MTVTLAELLEMPEGTILQRGNRKRIYLGFDGYFIFYTTPSSKKTTGESITEFRKWLLKAENILNNPQN